MGIEDLQARQDCMYYLGDIWWKTFAQIGLATKHPNICAYKIPPHPTKNLVKVVLQTILGI